MHRQQHVRGFKTRGEVARELGMTGGSFGYKILTGAIPRPTHLIPGYTTTVFYTEAEAQQIVEKFRAFSVT